MTRGPAGQRGVLAFANGHVRARGLRAYDVRTHENVDTAQLLHHDGGVELTHVTALVLRLDRYNSQGPCLMLVMGHLKPRVLCHDRLVEGQHGLVTRFYPADLKILF